MKKQQTDTGIRCPSRGENAAFCQGWYNNNDDYGGQDCGDEYETYTGPITNLIGCPLDIMKPSQIAALPILVGTWNFVKQTTGSMGNMSEISGTMLFKGNGYLKMTVPNKTALGDYTLEGSWGYMR